MAEYIEREQVNDELLSWAVCIKHPEHLLKEDALCVIDTIPAADVVEVCRCRDCKHFTSNLETDIFSGNDTFCGSMYGLIEPRENDFCSYGERKNIE